MRVLTGSSIGTTRLYTGREYETETGLYYMRARYYSPETGRFISRDPIDVSDDVNLYSYVGNDGVMFVDRMGLGKISVPKTASEHYQRNLLNINLPDTRKDAIDQGWILLAESKSAYHNSNAPIFDFNSKFISPDGHREAVYDYQSGIIITTAEDMGTYNYFSPLTHADKHRDYDVMPYYKWGNSADDPTNIIARGLKTGNLIPAGINEGVQNIDIEIQEIKSDVNNLNQVNFIINFINYAK